MENQTDGGVEHPSTPNVLIVCHANTSRSVMAHVLLEKMLAEQGAEHITVRSGGVALYARDGMIASLDARLILREVGIHLREEDFVSTDLKHHRHLIAHADLILAMTDEQKEMIAAYPEAAGKRVVTLRELAGESGDIEDPAMQGEEAFRARFVEINHCLQKGFPQVLKLAHESL